MSPSSLGKQWSTEPIWLTPSEKKPSGDLPRRLWLHETILKRTDRSGWNRELAASNHKVAQIQVEKKLSEKKKKLKTPKRSDTVKFFLLRHFTYSLFLKCCHERRSKSPRGYCTSAPHKWTRKPLTVPKRTRYWSLPWRWPSLRLSQEWHLKVGRWSEKPIK